MLTLVFIATLRKMLQRCDQILDSGQIRPNDFFAMGNTISAFLRDIKRGQIAEMKARAHRADWDRMTPEQRDMYARETSIARLRREGFIISRPPEGFVPDKMPMPIDEDDDE